jgi:hypothetical protein
MSSHWRSRRCFLKVWKVWNSFKCLACLVSLVQMPIWVGPISSSATIEELQTKEVQRAVFWRSGRSRRLKLIGKLHIPTVQLILVNEFYFYCVKCYFMVYFGRSLRKSIFKKSTLTLKVISSKILKIFGKLFLCASYEEFLEELVKFGRNPSRGLKVMALQSFGTRFIHFSPKKHRFFWHN